MEFIKNNNDFDEEDLKFKALNCHYGKNNNSVVDYSQNNLLNIIEENQNDLNYETHNIENDQMFLNKNNEKIEILIEELFKMREVVSYHDKNEKNLKEINKWFLPKQFDLKEMIELCKHKNINDIEFILEWTNLFINNGNNFYEFFNAKNQIIQDTLKEKFNIVFQNKKIIGISDFLTLIDENTDVIKPLGYMKAIYSPTRELIINSIWNFKDMKSERCFDNMDIDYKYIDESLLENLAIALFTCNKDNILNICQTVTSNVDSDIDLLTLCVSLPKLLNVKSNNSTDLVEILDMHLKRIKKDPTKSLLKYVYIFLLQENEMFLSDFFNNKSIKLGIKLTFIFSQYKEYELNKKISELQEFTFRNCRIRGLILNGTSKESNNLLESYNNRYDDFIFSYILANYYCTNDSQFLSKISAIFNEYINSFKYFDLRNKINTYFENLNSERVDIEEEYKKKKPTSFLELDISCVFCGYTIISSADKILKDNGKLPLITKVCTNKKCEKPLPSCCICLESFDLKLFVGKNKLSAKQDKMLFNSNYETQQNVDKSKNIIWCLNCKHGGHFNHMIDWFKELTICPNPTCQCACLEYSINCI